MDWKKFTHGFQNFVYQNKICFLSVSINFLKFPCKVEYIHMYVGKIWKLGLDQITSGKGV